MRTEDEWVDITAEVTLETNLECEDGKIIVPKWPGMSNLKVLRRKEKKTVDLSKLIKPGDQIHFIKRGFNKYGICFGSYACSVGYKYAVATIGGCHVELTDAEIFAITRDAFCIYNAETTSTDTPANSAKSD